MKTIRKKLRDENGAIMIMIALMLVVFLGFAALVIDIGLVNHNVARLQTASDAVSLAAANYGNDVTTYDPTSSPTQSASLKKRVQTYFEQNDIHCFKYVKGDSSKTNIYVWKYKNRNKALEAIRNNESKDAVYVLYTYKDPDQNTKKDGYRYVEIIAHMKSSTIMAGMFDLNAFELTTVSAAKTNLYAASYPEALNYQLLSLDDSTTTDTFHITGPIDETGLKTFTNLIGSGLTSGISTIRGFATAISSTIFGANSNITEWFRESMTCRSCAFKGSVSDFVRYDSSGNIIGYYCPQCGTENDTGSDSDAVNLNITTATAVLNGYIHSNGRINITTDVIRLNRYLENSIHENDENVIDTDKSNDIWTIYTNGKKYSSRPIVETAGNANDIDLGSSRVGVYGAIAGGSADIFFAADDSEEIDGDGNITYKTVYKTATIAQPWDFGLLSDASGWQVSRTNKQLLYGGNTTKNGYTYDIANQEAVVENILDPALINIMHNGYKYNEVKSNAKAATQEVPTILKQTSGLSYKVDISEDNVGETTPQKEQKLTTSFNVKENPLNLFEKTKINNTTEYPNAYAVLDNSHSFNFDFTNGTQDSLKDVMTNTVNVRSGAEEKDTAIAQIVANARVSMLNDAQEVEDTGSDTEYDTSVRIELDSIITDITSDEHTYDKYLQKYSTFSIDTFIDYFDINIAKANNKKVSSVQNNLSNTESNITSADNPSGMKLQTGGIGQTVSYYNNYIKNYMQKGNNNGLDNNGKPKEGTATTSLGSRRMASALTEIENLKNTSSTSPVLQFDGQSYYGEDMVLGADGVKTYTPSQVAQSYLTYELQHENTFPSTSGWTTNTTSLSGKIYDKDKQPTDAQLQLIFADKTIYTNSYDSPYYRQGVWYKHHYWTHVGSGSQSYLNGSFTLSDDNSSRKYLQLDSGTSDDRTQFYINGDLKINGADGNGLILGDYCDLIVKGSVLINKRNVTIGSNSRIIVLGETSTNLDGYSSKGFQCNGKGVTKIGTNSKLIVNGLVDCSSIEDSSQSTIVCNAINDGNASLSLNVGSLFTVSGCTAANTLSINGSCAILGGNTSVSKSALTVAENACIVLEDTSNMSGFNLNVGSQVFIADTDTSNIGSVTFKNNTRFFADGAVESSGTINGKDSSNWIMIVRGNANFTGTGEGGVGTNSYVYINGTYNGGSGTFTNKGVFYVNRDYSATGNINNQSRFFVNGNVTGGSVTNSSEVFINGGLGTYNYSNGTGSEIGSITNAKGAYITCKSVSCKAGINNSGLLYVSEGDLACYWIVNNYEEGVADGFLYVNKSLRLSSNETTYIKGRAYIGGLIGLRLDDVGAGTILKLYGIVCVNGLPVDSSNKEVSDRNLADHINGISGQYIDTYDDVQLFVNGRVETTKYGFVVEDTNTGDDTEINGQVFIYDPNDSTPALNLKTYLKLDSSAKMFVYGDAKFGKETGSSIRCGIGSYLRVTGTLNIEGAIHNSTNTSTFMPNGTYIHCGTLIAQDDVVIGETNATTAVLNASGFVVDNNATITKKLHTWINVYIGGNLSTGAKLYLDDQANIAVSGNITSEEVFFWDSSQLFVKGDVNASVKFSNDNNGNNALMLVTGNVTATSDVEVAGMSSLMIDGYLTCGGKIDIDDQAKLFADDYIRYNSGTTNVDNILYTDGDIDSNSSSKLYYGNIHKVYPYPPGDGLTRGNITYYQKTFTNSDNDLGADVTVIGSDYSFGVNDGRTLFTPSKANYISNIKAGVTLKVVGGDIYLVGHVKNYGKIICLSDENGNGGNIYCTDKKGKKYDDCKGGSLQNYGSIYADKNCQIMVVDVDETAEAVTGNVANGNSFKNGNNNNHSAKLYVGGKLEIASSIENHGEVYSVGDIDLATHFNGVVNTNDSSDPHVGLDNKNKSVLMSGGSIICTKPRQTGGVGNTVYDWYPGEETVEARTDSVLYAEGDITCDRNFIIGNAWITGGTSSDEGGDQFKFMHSSAYDGLNSDAAGYIIVDQTYEGSMKIVNSDSPGIGEISTNKVNGKLYDIDGTKVADVMTQVGSYVIYESSITGSGTNTYADFGFCYVGGVLKTGEASDGSDDNWVKLYGKSCLYVANKNNQDIACKTNALTTFPYSRMYINGDVTLSGTPRSSKHSSSVGWNSWFYSISYINGNVDVNKGQTKLRDATYTLVKGHIKSQKYAEIGKSYDGIDEALDPNNPAFVQCQGDFTVKTGYLKVYARATLNANGNITASSDTSNSSLLEKLQTWLSPNGYITLRHHANVRAHGDLIAKTSIDVGSGSTVYAGGDMKATLSTIKIRDDCIVSVGGVNGGDMKALSYIEIGKHEDEAYKYLDCEENRKNSSTPSDYSPISKDDAVTGASDDEEQNVGSDIKVICPNCGKKGSITDGTFTEMEDDQGNTLYKCSQCTKTFTLENATWQGDDADGSTVYVDGTIQPTMGHLTLFANTSAYVNKSVRSYNYITLRHHASLYVLADAADATGIIYPHNENGQLLNAADNDNVVPGFYVNTDMDSSEYGNIYYKNATITVADDDKDDGSTKTITVNLYGFYTEMIESDDADDAQYATLNNGTLYYYDTVTKGATGNEHTYNDTETGEKKYATMSSYEDVDMDVVATMTSYYYISYADAGSGKQYVVMITDGDPSDMDQSSKEEVQQINPDGLKIKIADSVGSVTSYGGLTLNTGATVYSTGNVSCLGKYFGGEESTCFALGNFKDNCVIKVSIATITGKENVCGFELKHGAVYAGGDLTINSCANIEGGVIDGVGNVTFNSIYTKYIYDDDVNVSPYTDNTTVDLWTVSEKGNIKYNNLYIKYGGVTYAPGTENETTGDVENGKIEVSSTYFDYYGCLIAYDNDITAWYINFHRLPNMDTLKMSTTRSGKVYLVKTGQVEENSTTATTAAGGDSIPGSDD